MTPAPSSRHRRARRRDRHPPRLALQPPLERQDPLPDRARRHRHRPGVMSQGGGWRRRRSPRPTTCRRRPRCRSPGRCVPTRGRRAATSSTSQLVEVHGASHDYPITPKEHGIDFLMDHRHLWLRAERQHAILRVRHEVIKAIRDFFDDRGFTLVDTPIFTPDACEGTTTLFPVQYFDDRRRYLTQSGQLYSEAARWRSARSTASARPSARRSRRRAATSPSSGWWSPRSPSSTSTTSWSSPRTSSTSVVARVLDTRAGGAGSCSSATSRKLEAITGAVPAHPLRRGRDRSCTSKGLPFQWGDDFGGTDETVLSRAVRPAGAASPLSRPSIKAFYMKPDPDAAGRGALRGRARARGLRRDHRRRPARRRPATCCSQRIEEHKLPQEAFEWYLDLRRYGTVPHAGFGMGIERSVAWICGLEHVRETIPFPRMLYRLYP